MAQTWGEPPGGCRRLSKKTVVADNFDGFRNKPTTPGKQQSAARTRLNKHCERLAWGAYLRVLRLQEDEPGPKSDIIRHAVFKVWEQAFLAGEVAP